MGINHDPTLGLPTGKGLDRLLGLEFGSGVSDLVQSSLMDPVNEFLGRPGKHFRGQLLHWSYCLATEKKSGDLQPADEALVHLGSKVLEQIHAGSLVVDDIQDNSLVRRGQPTLHLSHGVPMALNAGNWLYFWPFQQLAEARLAPEVELRVYQVCHQALLKAHFGQALDVGVPIDSLPASRIRDVCLASLELKTGALMELAMSLGAVLGAADAEVVESLGHFGRRFGVALQMLDDIGNVTGKKSDANDPKRFEDLKLRRPSWMWAVVVDGGDPRLKRFSKVVSALPDSAPLEKLLAEEPLVDEAAQEAHSFLNYSIEGLTSRFRKHHPEAVDAIVDLGKKLAKAYS